MDGNECDHDRHAYRFPRAPAMIASISPGAGQKPKCLRRIKTDMTPQEEYQTAYAQAWQARTRVETLLKLAERGLVEEVEGWQQGGVALIGARNTWRAYGAQKCFDACSSAHRRNIGDAISAWYFAMQKLEAKWDGVRSPNGQDTDLPDPESLIG